MSAQFVTVTALAIGLLLSTGVVAQQTGESAQGAMDKADTPAVGQDTPATSDAISTQDFGPALTKLENAQKQFRNADVPNSDVNLEVARGVARDAIADIEMKLDSMSQDADDSQVSGVRAAIEDVKPLLDLDREADMLANRIGELHSAVLGLQAANAGVGTNDKSAMADQ